MEEPLQKIKEIIVRSCLGECTEDERIRLEQWCQEDRVHEEFYRRVSSQDNLELKLRELSSINTQQAFIYNQRILKRRAIRRMVKKSLPYAACLVVVLGLSLGWLLHDHQQEVLEDIRVVLPGTKQTELVLADGSIVPLVPEMYERLQEGRAEIAVSGNSVDYSGCGSDTAVLYNTIRTPLGGEYVVVLSDGTKVWLNAMSQLTYPVNFRGDERTVKLSGEAYFEVVKDSKRFVVSTVMGDVNVLGTTFGVKAYKNEEAVYTTLVTGKVNFKGRETLILEPGEQAVAFVNGKMEKRKVDVNEYIGWKNGLYVFRKQNLESIMNDLARWYDVNVFYQTPGLKDIAFTGNLKRSDKINTFMKILARTGDIKYRIEGNTILLYK